MTAMPCTSFVLLILSAAAHTHVARSAKQEAIQASVSCEAEAHSLLQVKSHEKADGADAEADIVYEASMESTPVTPEAPGAPSDLEAPDPSYAVDVTNFMVPPSKKPLNLTNPRTRFYSQIGQDKWVLQALAGRRDIFVLESGAFDGESLSNSLFFEKEQNASCLLVEPNPVLQNQILRKQRHCHLLKGGLSITDATSSFDFEMAGPLGGLRSTLGSEQARIDKEMREATSLDASWTGKTIKVHCFPLDTIMQQIGRATIDYWSLDVEGAESAILSNTDFDKIEVGVITVEHNSVPAHQKKIFDILTQKGFKRVTSGYQDDYYANTKYFEKRSIAFPER